MASRLSVELLARSLAIGASLALHAGVLGAILLLRGPNAGVQGETHDFGVEIGVVYREPPHPPIAAPVLQPTAAPRSVARVPPRRAVGAPAAHVADPAEEIAQGAEPQAAVADEGAMPIPVGVPDGVPGAPGAPSGSGEAPIATSGTGTGSGVGPPGGGGPDVDAEIARRLAAAAAHCYPRAASRLRAEGVAKVRFCIGEDGQPRDATLVESTGIALLDEAALSCVVARAAPFPRTTGCLSVPVRFRLVP